LQAGVEVLIRLQRVDSLIEILSIEIEGGFNVICGSREICRRALDDHRAMTIERFQLSTYLATDLKLPGK